MKLFGKRDSSASRRNSRLLALRLKQVCLTGALVCAVIGGIVYGIYSGSFLTMRDWAHEKTLEASAAAGFRVNEILVTGRRYASQQALLTHLNIREGQPIFGIALDEAQKSLNELPWVEKAVVFRRLPDKIIVDIQERHPVALWQYQKKVALIDAKGAIVTSNGLEEWQSLPLIVGEGAPEKVGEIVNLMRAEPDIAEHLASAVRVGNRRWDLNLKTGLQIKLPENNLELALRRVAEYQKRHALLDKDINVIDLRIPEKFVIEPAVTAEAATTADAKKKI